MEENGKYRIVAEQPYAAATTQEQLRHEINELCKLREDVIANKKIEPKVQIVAIEEIKKMIGRKQIELQEIVREK